MRPPSCNRPVLTAYYLGTMMLLWLTGAADPLEGAENVSRTVSECGPPALTYREGALFRGPQGRLRLVRCRDFRDLPTDTVKR